MSTCLPNTTSTYANALQVCSAIGMTLYDLGSSSDSRSLLETFAQAQNKNFSFWVNDSAITANCPRLDYTGTTWKENTNANCSDVKQIFCQYMNPIRKFLVDIIQN